MDGQDAQDKAITDFKFEISNLKSSIPILCILSIHVNFSSLDTANSLPPAVLTAHYTPKPFPLRSGIIKPKFSHRSL